jgi:hypothetical protein
MQVRFPEGQRPLERSLLGDADEFVKYKKYLKRKAIKEQRRLKNERKLQSRLQRR